MATLTCVLALPDGRRLIAVLEAEEETTRVEVDYQGDLDLIRARDRTPVLSAVSLRRELLAWRQSLGGELTIEQAGAFAPE
jgi:hypothetical protein